MWHSQGIGGMDSCGGTRSRDLTSEFTARANLAFPRRGEWSTVLPGWESGKPDQAKAQAMATLTQEKDTTDRVANRSRCLGCSLWLWSLWPKLLNLIYLFLLLLSPRTGKSEEYPKRSLKQHDAIANLWRAETPQMHQPTHHISKFWNKQIDSLSTKRNYKIWENWL